jgi:hypothetical protein
MVCYNKTNSFLSLIKLRFKFFFEDRLFKSFSRTSCLSRSPELHKVTFVTDRELSQAPRLD